MQDEQQISMVEAGVGLRTPWPQARLASGAAGPPSSPGLHCSSLGDKMFPQPSLGAARDRGQPQPQPARHLGRVLGPASFSSRLCPKVDFWEKGRDGGGGAVMSFPHTQPARRLSSHLRPGHHRAL